MAQFCPPSAVSASVRPDAASFRDPNAKRHERMSDGTIGRVMTAERDRLATLLAPLGVEYQLFACDPALADTAAFCAAYGFDPEDSANTIVVVGKADPRVYAACVVLAPDRLDVNHAVRDRLGTRKASFASADETRDLSGMEIGGVTPFGLPAAIPIWIDAGVMRRERIVLGGGSRSWKVLAAPTILLAIPNATVVEGLAQRPAG
jgi:prolyl-tRNA editing enzyme YbaK/EbsC (Cys-tRNA(Pro) deacylase)